MSEQKYFYIENGTQTGPVSAEELLGKISPNTDIWCAGMANWAPANTVPEVAALLGGGVAAPVPSTPDPAASQYSGGSGDYAAGNSQNYGNPNYANQQTYGNAQNYGNTQMPTGQKPDNYLVLAILCTVLCCLPFGIVSIINAVKVDSEWNAGHYDEAMKASANAKKFAIIGAIGAAVIGLIYFLLVAAAGVAGM